MEKIFACCFFMLGLAGIAYCGQTSRIELTDGNTINAEVVSFNNGTYTLKSAGLGEMQVDASKIRSIEAPNAIPKNAPDAASVDIIKSKMGTMEEAITNNPEAMKSVAGLLADPQFQEVMQDPEIVKAAKEKDIKTLVNNPKFLDLVDNPKIKEIESKMKQ